MVAGEVLATNPVDKEADQYVETVVGCRRTASNQPSTARRRSSTEESEVIILLPVAGVSLSAGPQP